ncbi:MAG: hypothetical protein KAR12_17310 [Methylococcales bacterium]|nr:hypothetical protein [Methylococcales bacterium]
MIDKLNKWIYRQKLFNSLLGKEYLAMRIELPPTPDVEFPEAPICPPLGKVKDINDYIQEGIEAEREACAKLCDDNPFVCDDRVGIWLADLIRERSTGE